MKRTNLIQCELFNLDSIRVIKRFKNKLVFNLDCLKSIEKIGDGVVDLILQK